jgi:hypothetical protein
MLRRLCTMALALATLLGAMLSSSRAQACPQSSTSASPNSTIVIPEPADGGVEPCAQVAIAGAQWVTPGNVLFVEPGTSALSDVLQLSNVGGNALVTLVSDQDDGGVDPSQLPVALDAGLPTLRTVLESPTTFTRVSLLGQQLQLPSGSITAVSISAISDGDNQPGPRSDFLSTVPAAPPFAIGALALILMAGGVFMARRQYFKRG